MRFLAHLIGVAVALCTSVSVNAQIIAFPAPTPGTNVKAGKKLVVEVDHPNTISPSVDVSIVLGFSSCASFPCSPPDGIMGNILFNGLFRPVLDPNEPRKPPHQNYTVTIPAGTPQGAAQLNIAHTALLGAGPSPLLETFSIALNVV